MSFLNITDPKKRDLIVAEFLETKRNIRNQQIAERLGEQDTLAELTKQYKPITDVQKDLTQSIISEITPIKKSIQDALTFPKISAIEDDEEEGVKFFSQPGRKYGDIAVSYLRKFVTKDADKTYGMYDKDGEFYIGDTKVGVIDDNIMVGDKEYEGTPGLWELIVMRIPNDNVYTSEDYENYAEILINSNALRKGNSSLSKTPKASKGWKWKYLLKTIWDERKKFSGDGLQTIILPSDPNALLDRLDILMASKAAGNTGVRNELVSICDELKRQKVIDANTYKKLMSTL